MKKPLYPWQEECLDRWFANGGRGMVQAVTGSGKTLLALAAIDRLEKELCGSLSVKIVVPTASLMRQWYQSLREYFAPVKDIRHEIGMRGGGQKNLDRKYMIYVINSARYELARQILSEIKSGKNVLLIADECHHYESGENRLIFEFLPYINGHEKHFFSMGLSATLPFGAAGDYLSSVLGKRIYTYGMKKALDLKTVCQYDIYHISLSLCSKEREEYENMTDRMQTIYKRLLKAYPELRFMNQKELYEALGRIAGNKKHPLCAQAALYVKLTYTRRSIVCLASERTKCAVELMKRLGCQEKVIIFSERIDQTEELYGLLQKYFPGKVGRFHSKMGNQANHNALERFRDGDFRILTACKAIDEGVDVPDASVAVILSGTSGQRQRIQRLGRIIRNKKDKTKASLYYLHVVETSEDMCYLPNAKDSHVYELEYSSRIHDFINSPYDRIARLFLKEMKAGGIDDRQFREVYRCLSLGIVRADWQLTPREISAKISETKDLSRKNYWICMKKMAEIWARQV